MKELDRLDGVQVVTPCSVPWSGMDGDARSRFCGQCRKTVHDLSALTRAQALALIDDAHGSVCVRLMRRTDGTVVTGDGRERIRRVRRPGFLAFAALPFVLAAELWAQSFGLRGLASKLCRPPLASDVRDRTDTEVRPVSAPSPVTRGADSIAGDAIASRERLPAPIHPANHKRRQKVFITEQLGLLGAAFPEDGAVDARRAK